MILGANPYDVCFMNGFGQNNPPPVTADFGHGTQKGGIFNGITCQEGNGDVPVSTTRRAHWQ